MSMSDQHAVVEAPTSFSVHHLSWLHRHGFLHDLPHELGPFPVNPDLSDTGAFDALLGSQLSSWGIVSDGVLNPDAGFLFESLMGQGAEWVLWGTVLLYSLKTDARASFDPKGIDEWGLKHAVRDVPRVQFMIAHTPREIVSAINAPPNLIINRIPVTGEDIALQTGRVLRALLDPQENWKPWSGPTVTAKMAEIRTLAENPELSRLDLEDEEALTRRPDQMRRALLGMELSPKTAETMAELSRFPTTAAAQVSVNYPTPGGLVTPKVAMGVTFFDGAGIMVSYPVGKTDETRAVYYVPGDEKGFTDGVRAMVAAAEAEAGQ